MLITKTLGWTVFDKLYVLNGTIFVVTSSPEAIPETKFLTSSGYDIRGGEEEVRKRLPTDKDIRIITPDDAQRLFGAQVQSHVSQCGETALKDEVARVLTLSPPETRTIYVKGEVADGSNGDNWVIRWMLWFESDSISITSSNRN